MPSTISIRKRWGIRMDTRVGVLVEEPTSVDTTTRYSPLSRRRGTGNTNRLAV
jgi:hypothetical protein